MLQGDIMTPAERMLEDARHLRRAAKLLADIDASAIAALMRVAEKLQNEACGFEGPAAPYDTAVPADDERQKLGG
jgi:hypothetical protein